MTRFEDAPICDIVSAYESGMTIEQVGKKYDVPSRTIHLWLCRIGIPRRQRAVPKGYHFSEERNRKLSASLKGRTFTVEQRKRMSEAKLCHYNGLNGYGHLKNQNTGYILTYCPDHPRSHRDGYILFHTVVMERHIGRYLADDEVVHHINHDRADNRIENLMLMKKKEHMSMHMKERYQKRRELLCNA